MKLYQALGLTNTASAEDIRRAYRRLVLLTHPDRTPDPAAHARYLDINAAYEVLSDPARRASYDASSRLNTVASAQTEPSRSTRDRTGRYATTAQRPPRPKTESYAHEGIYLQYAPLGRAVCRALLVFSLLLGIDRIWVLAYPREEVLNCTLYSTSGGRRGGSYSYCVVKTQNATFRGPCLNTGEVLSIRRTALFGQVLSLEGTDTSEYGFPSRYWDENLLYAGAGLLFIVSMVATAAVGAWPGSAGRRQLDCAVMGSILAIVVLWFLVTH